MDIVKPQTHNEKDVVKYFKYSGKPWGVLFLLLISVIGIILIPIIWKIYSKPKLSDYDIDKLWDEVAKSREDEAYRVANYDKEDALRDAQYFLAYPSTLSPNSEFREKEGDDGYFRRNHMKLVYMIYGRDQLIVFDENICLDDLWDGSDRTEEYYWSDVSSVTFDERQDMMQIAVGPKIINYPLTGEELHGDEEALERSAYFKQAQEVANAVRMILREKKSSS